MAGRALLYGGASGINFSLLQNQRVYSSLPEPHDSIFISASSSSFHGPRSMVNFEDVNGEKRSERSFYHSFDQEENGDEELDEYFWQPEKKKRLTVEQVQFLERNFEVENRLEPDRKTELAKQLGLQPRQIAIWFQNRRARWKTKQLEKDYEGLQASFTSLKADYDNLLKEKDKLTAEVAQLTDKLLPQQRENENSNLCHGCNLSAERPKGPSTDSIFEDEVSKISALGPEQEDLSSAKSDVFLSNSPCFTDGVHSSVWEQGKSSYVFEPDHSDPCQDQEDIINKNLLRPYGVPKIEDACYTNLPSLGYFVFPVEDQAFGFCSNT